MEKDRARQLRLYAGLAGFIVASIAQAAPVTVTDVFHHLDNRSANNTGVSAGLRQFVGAVSVVPNGTDGTTGLATQGGSVITLTHQNLTVAPNFFSSAPIYSNTRNGAWDLEFNNDGDVTRVSTPDIVGAQVMDFAKNVTISGSGGEPTFTWTLPAGVTPDAFRINIFDLSSFTTSVADVIFSTNIVDSTIRSFTISAADTSLDNGKPYSIEIGFLQLRDPNIGVTNANILSRSRSFFEFWLLPEQAPPNVFLPTVLPSGAYSFSIDVLAQSMVFIDPLIAIGYDYAIGAGDPNFASVQLPVGIGDGLYDLLIWDGSDYVEFMTDVMGGLEFLFPAGGVSRFRVSGIEESAGLDPLDVTAFITGLTFVADGTFTGTMTPIVIEVASVPEPPVLALLAMALIALGLRRSTSRSRLA